MLLRLVLNAFTCRIFPLCFVLLFIFSLKRNEIQSARAAHDNFQFSFLSLVCTRLFIADCWMREQYFFFAPKLSRAWTPIAMEFSLCVSVCVCVAFCLYSTSFFQLPSIYVYERSHCATDVQPNVCAALWQNRSNIGIESRNRFLVWKCKKGRPKNVLQDVVLLTHVRRVRLGTEGTEFWAGHERIIKGERAFALFLLFWTSQIRSRFNRGKCYLCGKLWGKNAQDSGARASNMSSTAVRSLFFFFFALFFIVSRCFYWKWNRKTLRTVWHTLSHHTAYSRHNSVGWNRHSIISFRVYVLLEHSVTHPNGTTPSQAIKGNIVCHRFDAFVKQTNGSA